MPAEQTRRGFIGGVFAAASLPAVGGLASEPFRDLEPQRDYVLHWRQSSSGKSREYHVDYPKLGYVLTAAVRAAVGRPDGIAGLAARGYRLDSHSSGLILLLEAFRTCGSSVHVRDDSFDLTSGWLDEFYRRHKDDTAQDWQGRYEAYFNGYLDDYSGRTARDGGKRGD